MKISAYGNDNVPFNRNEHGVENRKPSEGKTPRPSQAINRNNVIYTRTRHFPRLRLHTHPKFHEQEVLWKPGYAPLNKGTLEIVFARFNAMTALAGVNAACIRFDLPAGTPAEKIQALLARLQDQARLRRTRIHFVVQAEYAADQEANHWHGIILFDQSKMDFPRQINTTWKKVCPEYRISYRRNGNLPFFFAIGNDHEEFKAAFRAASYLCKLNTPPLTLDGKKTRITSRLPPRVTQNEALICDNTPATAGEKFCEDRFSIMRSTPTTSESSALQLQAV